MYLHNMRVFDTIIRHSIVCNLPFRCSFGWRRGVKVSLSIKSCSRRSHEASPRRSLIMGRSSNLSMQYVVFLLLIVIATTTQAHMLGYQDRRNDSHHDPRKITQTQQPRYLKITKKKGFFFNRF